MIFNSIEFGLFLPIVFILYWIVLKEKTKLQNALLLVASYFFYGYWDYRFLGLILFSSVLDFYVAKNLKKTEKKSKRKQLLLISILVNIGFLAVFKYYNFFSESLANAFTFFGAHLEVYRLNWILPVGISFYTFQTLSYTIDVYKGKLEPASISYLFYHL